MSLKFTALSLATVFVAGGIVYTIKNIKETNIKMGENQKGSIQVNVTETFNRENMKKDQIEIENNLHIDSNLRAFNNLCKNGEINSCIASAWYYILKKDLDHAEDSFRRATEIDHNVDKYTYYFNLGHYHLLKSHREKALKLYGKSLNISQKPIDEMRRIVNDDFKKLRKVYPDKIKAFNLIEQNLLAKLNGRDK